MNVCVCVYKRERGGGGERETENRDREGERDREKKTETEGERAAHRPSRTPQHFSDRYPPVNQGLGMPENWIADRNHLAESVISLSPDAHAHPSHLLRACGQ